MKRITITACGTSFYAGLVAKYWFERIAQLPVDIDVASEFRYREPPLEPDGLRIVVSQSGETADTLASLRYAKSQGAAHPVHRECRRTRRWPARARPWRSTMAGLEIGVASTKAFTCQLTVFACLALAAGLARGTLDARRRDPARRGLIASAGPDGRGAEGEHRSSISPASVAKAQDVLYLGRGTSFPVALEGALKLKEISYIHAEGYAAGELKHGPIALIDEQMPVIVIAPHDDLFEKTASNVAGGRRARRPDHPDHRRAGRARRSASPTEATIILPRSTRCSPRSSIRLPVQLLAYHTAVFMGKDVDQPRNLAKSVTVSKILVAGGAGG